MYFRVLYEPVLVRERKAGHLKRRRFWAAGVQVNDMLQAADSEITSGCQWQWSQLRRRFTPGFEDLLELGVTNDWYDTNHPLDV
jgi:hypothetical protein